MISRPVRRFSVIWLLEHGEAPDGVLFYGHQRLEPVSVKTACSAKPCGVLYWCTFNRKKHMDKAMTGLIF
jgi:hypothetical protein